MRHGLAVSLSYNKINTLTLFLKRISKTIHQHSSLIIMIGKRTRLNEIRIFHQIQPYQQIMMSTTYEL